MSRWKEIKKIKKEIKIHRKEKKKRMLFKEHSFVIDP